MFQLCSQAKKNIIQSQKNQTSTSHCFVKCAPLVATRFMSRLRLAQNMLDSWQGGYRALPRTFFDMIFSSRVQTRHESINYVIIDVILLVMLYVNVESNLTLSTLGTAIEKNGGIMFRKKWQNTFRKMHFVPWRLLR